jgi:hypothetical protein
MLPEEERPKKRRSRGKARQASPQRSPEAEVADAEVWLLGSEASDAEFDGIPEPSVPKPPLPLQPPSPAACV